MTLQTIELTDSFEAWRQKDNATVALVNALDTTVANIQGQFTAPASVTYYVRTDGNDANAGTTDSAGGALLTGQAAVNKAHKLKVDTGITATIVFSGSGTFTAPIVVAGSMVGSLVTGSMWQFPLVITGGSGVILTSINEAATLTVGPGAMVKLTGGIKVQASGTSGARHGVLVQNGGIFEVGSVNFGACTGDQINAAERGMVIAKTSYTISGSAAHHIGAYFNSLVVSSGVTVTLTGAPGFTSFIESSDKSVVSYVGNTFSGSATGSRFNAIRSGSIFTGSNIAYLPGSTAGTQSQGGNYDAAFVLGSLDSTAIGATTPSTGSFTNLAATSLSVNGSSNLNNNLLLGIKSAALSSGVATSGTTGVVSINWTSGGMASQNLLTGDVTYTMTAPTDANTWLTIMGAAGATPYALTWPGSVKWYGSTFGSTIAAKGWIVRLFWDGTNYHAFGASQV